MAGLPERKRTIQTLALPGRRREDFEGRRDAFRRFRRAGLAGLRENREGKLLVIVDQRSGPGMGASYNLRLTWPFPPRIRSGLFMLDRLAWAPSRAALVPLLLGAALLVGCAGPMREDPNSQAGLDKLYSDAKDDLTVGSYEPAIKKLEALESRAAGTVLGQQAMLDMAWAQYRSSERAAAITTLDRFLKLHPSSPGVEYAMYLKGLVNFNEDLGLFGRIAGQDVAERDQQASKDALLAFRELVDRYPSSRYAEDARIRIDFITNTLARHEVHVARYYLNRGAFVAAANRAQVSITDYPYAPATEEALVIMATAYDRLGLTELATDARRVLQLNFPNNAALSPAPQAKPWWKLW